MKHALATVEFFIKKSDYTGAGKVTKIELSNRKGLATNVIPLDVQIDLIAGEVRLDGEGNDYSQKVVNEQGLMPALTTSYPASPVNLFTLTRGVVISLGDAIVTFTIDGKNYAWNVPKDTAWKSGYRYSYYVTISGSQLILDTVTIVEPEDGGSLEVIL